MPVTLVLRHRKDQSPFRRLLLGLVAAPGAPLGDGHVVPLFAPRKNWHAKIAIRHDSGAAPIAALVGSSNLTGPAFAEPHLAWNYECDALIWQDTSVLTSYFRDLLRDLADDRVSRMDLILDPKVEQPTEVQQLEHLRTQILASGVKRYDA